MSDPAPPSDTAIIRDALARCDLPKTAMVGEFVIAFTLTDVQGSQWFCLRSSDDLAPWTARGLLHEALEDIDQILTAGRPANETDEDS